MHGSDFNRILTYSSDHHKRGQRLWARDGRYSWTDLDSDEQRAIAMLGAGGSAELCDPVAILTLTRLGLVRGLRLTPMADQLRRAAILHELAA